MQSKILNRGQKAMMVGYGCQNGDGVFRMYKFDTKKITQTRDIRWTYKLYGETELMRLHQDTDSDFESEYESEEENNQKAKDETEHEVTKRVHNALKKLHTLYNPTLSNLVMENDIALVGGTDNMHKNPMTFDEAWNNPEEKERKSWQLAIKKEFTDMIN